MDILEQLKKEIEKADWSRILDIMDTEKQEQEGDTDSEKR